YVSRLRAIGLAEEGPADDSLAVQYDILLGEPALREAQDADDIGRLGTRVIKRTLRVSPLGRRLWLACRPAEEVEPDLSRLSDAAIRASDGVDLTPLRPTPNGSPAGGRTEPDSG